MRNLVTIGIITVLATLSACAPKPKQRSWTTITHDSRDDQSQYRFLTHAHLEERRTAALESRSYDDVKWYIGTLNRYLWEVEPLLAARDRAAQDPEYDYEAPPEIAAIDRAALIAEAEAMIVELESGGIWYPDLWTDLLVAKGDCKAFAAEVAVGLSCVEMPSYSAFDEAKAVCGEITTICRETLDRMEDDEAKYYLMRKCGQDMSEGTNQTEEQALATWLTPEEMEVWHEQSALAQAAGAAIMADVESARQDAEAENQRRLAEYEQSGGPPPALITSVGVDITEESDGVQHSEIVTAVFENQCEKQIYVKNGTTGKRELVDPGKSIALELRRCSELTMGEVTVGMTRSMSYVLRSDCETIDALRPQTP
jgi:hypothetical protein